MSSLCNGKPFSKGKKKYTKGRATRYPRVGKQGIRGWTRVTQEACKTRGKLKDQGILQYLSF